MPTPALEVAGAVAQAVVQVERGDRAARALPVAFGAGDQDDGTAVAFDQSRGDDPDHALVPALAGDDVAAPAAAGLRPGLDRLDRLAGDSLLDCLPVTVELLELHGELTGLLALLG